MINYLTTKNMNKIEVNYTITEDSNFLDKQNALTPELSLKLDKFHDMAIKGKRSGIPKIQKAIKQYPENPQLKNYLSAIYGQLGEMDKVYEINRKLIEEHPDYLFGKLNLTNEYLQKEEYHKIPEILGEQMELQALYPHRDTFHLNEVISFYRATVLYYTAISDLEQAELRYNIMYELAPEAYDTEVAMSQLFAARMKAGKARFDEEEKKRISVKTIEQKMTTTTEAPKYHHTEIDELYCSDMKIGVEKLTQILALPRKTLIQDLELVLNDSINRYSHYKILMEEGALDEQEINFVTHAIYLLGELEATDSLDSIFSVLSQSKEYLDLYFDNFIAGMLWEPVYKIANNQLEDCKQFLLKPNIDVYARSTFPDMVMQVALHQPERREEVLKWYTEIFQFFLASKIEDNVIDSDLIAFMVTDIIDINGKELKPVIEQLFSKEIVSQGVCGSWNDVNKAFDEPQKRDNRKDILSVAERYKDIIKTWVGYAEKQNSLADYNNQFEESLSPVRTEAKIGRNDPCPCGSGKKYKKCCLN